MDDNKWLENVPDEFVQLIEQILPIPYMLQHYITENQRLEAEVVVITNILIGKGMLNVQEIDAMTNNLLEERRKAAEEKGKSAPKVLTRDEYMKMQNYVHELLRRKKDGKKTDI